ncbi:2-oxoglutarate and iron-dependent oxygenase domain-containing protein [Mesorhizobium loti]|uniref:2-oxoglutarate and iron-dependent oxygenase domain-containing protein n=1 Tax=Rhizobium loti TaxID=381 RepID=UPI002477F1C0|nr:2-oxoglutarate and iron-dependent oxygenase domain-containing protein [Mesorhizobium loti]
MSLARLAADATRHEERERLRMTCEEYGFFYLVEHGIPKERSAPPTQAPMVSSRCQSIREWPEIVVPTPIVKQRCTHV